MSNLQKYLLWFHGSNLSSTSLVSQHKDRFKILRPSLFSDHFFTGLVESNENYVGNSKIKKQNQTVMQGTQMQLLLN